MAGKALRDTSAGRCAYHKEGVSHIQSHKAEARHTSGVLTPAHKDTAMKKRRWRNRERSDHLGNYSCCARWTSSRVTKLSTSKG